MQPHNAPHGAKKKNRRQEDAEGTLVLPLLLIRASMLLLQWKFRLQAAIAAMWDVVRRYIQPLAERCILAWLTRWLIYFNLGHVASFFNLWVLSPLPPAPASASDAPAMASISSLWLSSVLYERGIIDNVKVRLISVSIESVGDNRGLVSAIYRLRLHYSCTEAEAEAERGKGAGETSLVKFDAPRVVAGSLPSTLILKMNSVISLKKRMNCIARELCREALFLQKHGHDIHGFLPEIFYTSASPFLGSFAILMEDLEPYSTGLNFYFGNQIWGIKPLAAPRDPRRVLEDVVCCAAKLHASRWNDMSLFQESELKAVSWYQGQDEALWTLAMDAGRASWEKAKRNRAIDECSGTSKVTWSQKLINVIDRSYRYASWKALQDHLNDKSVPFTLTHGDFHASNMMWTTKLRDRFGSSDGRNTDDSECEGSLILLDFSEVGIWEPMTDIGQLMISDIEPELRRSCEKELLELYWRRLTNQGGVSPNEFPFHKCWELYEKGSVERWIWLFSVLASHGLPPAAVQYFHDQLLSFIEDHGDHPLYQLKPVVAVMPDRVTN